MTIKDDFQVAAVDIFDIFESIIINAIYIERAATYVAGGNVSEVDIDHNIRLIRETSKVETNKLADDVAAKAEVFMLIVDELPVVAKAKDFLKIGTITRPILAVEVDSADAIAKIWIE